MTRASDALTGRHLPAWLLLGMQGSVDGGQARRLWRSRWRGLTGRGGTPPPTVSSQGHRSPPERASFDRPSPEERRAVFERAGDPRVPRKGQPQVCRPSALVAGGRVGQLGQARVGRSHRVLPCERPYVPVGSAVGGERADGAPPRGLQPGPALAPPVGLSRAEDPPGPGGGAGAYPMAFCPGYPALAAPAF